MQCKVVLAKLPLLHSGKYGGEGGGGGCSNSSTRPLALPAGGISDELCEDGFVLVF
jgi:hypothetical protein